jgi:DNA-binding MarR family transcriptional regulator
MNQLDPSIYRACQSLLAHGISPQQAIILSACASDSPPIMSHLATLCGVSTAAMTGSIDRLIAIGYVERQPKEGDRRSILIATTPLGSSVIVKLNNTASKL